MRETQISAAGLATFHHFSFKSSRSFRRSLNRITNSGRNIGNVDRLAWNRAIAAAMRADRRFGVCDSRRIIFRW